MNRFIDNPVSSYLGLILIGFGLTLFFVPAVFEFPFYVPFIFVILGIGLIFAKDKLIDILTFGLSSLIEKFKK
jgi:hypothetical protein